VVRVGLIATYARWKGQDLFIDAAAKLIADHPAAQVRFFIIGGPIYRTSGSQFSLDELRQRVAEKGLARSIGFVPFQKDPAAVYRALDVVVHASTMPEPFGRTIVEAMSCGRAVIVSKAGGAVELFDDEQNALGVTPNDSEALATAMHRLVDNLGLRQRLGQAARAAAIEKFDRARLGADALRVYHKIMF
jgi:glycosyltransferase involved in cell wall biosynthesis